MNKWKLGYIDEFGIERDYYPDFKLFGQKGVIEVYGGKKNTKSQNRFNKKLETYARLGYVYRVFRGEDLQDESKKESIKEEVRTLMKEAAFENNN